MQRPKSTSTTDEAGHVNQAGSTWEDWFTHWAKVTYQRGTEPLVGDQRVGRRNPVVYMRWDSLTSQMTANHRLVHKGRVFSFSEPPRNVQEANIEVECACIEVANGGAA